MLWIDIETYSATELRTASVYSYVEDPGFEILMAGWTVDRENYHLALGEDAILQIPGLFTDWIVAHNAGFERICFSALERVKYQGPERYIDTMAIAAANGLPRGLNALAKALKVENKDSAGTRLINTFSKPNRGRRIMPEDKPELFEEFGDYCLQDVRVLVQVHDAIDDQRTKTEKRVYYVDQRINDRGIKVDTHLAGLAVVQAEVNTARQREEFTLLTGVNNPGSVQQVLAWFKEDGYPLPDMTKETVALHLGRTGDPVRDRALELRQDLALAANKKYVAALNMACRDERARGSLHYHGAHTGRWAGRGVQLQNLPSLSFVDEEGNWDEVAEKAALAKIFAGEHVDATTLKKLVRSMFLGPLTVADYKAIEAMVLAWLAGEEWVLRAFRQGEDIYVAQAKRLGPSFTRKDGKVATLALGFQGAVNSLRVMGGTGTDAELLVLVKAWRKANKHIVRLWYRMEDAFWDGGKVGDRLRVEVHGKDRHIVLPSGRKLIYRDVRESADKHLSFHDPRGFRQDTYGGRLIENVTQATARDLLAEALLLLENEGFRVVSHVHDEVLVETIDEERVVELMTRVPRWAPGLPLAAEAKVMERYRKA